MARRDATIDRSRRRLDELMAGLEAFVRTFDRSRLFTGPSVYFHNCAIERLRTHISPAEALGDDLFLETVYATLASWGMHRMGDSPARMVEFEIFRDGFQAQTAAINEIQNIKLSELSDSDVPAIALKLWRIISGLTIGIGETKIVSGSKALHHVLPDLIPPIDRQYTARFFFHHKTFNQGDRAAFFDMFPGFHRIARDGRDVLSELIGQGWMSTSATKIIDNAIVGWVIEHYGKKEPDSGISQSV